MRGPLGVLLHFLLPSSKAICSLNERGRNFLLLMFVYISAEFLPVKRN